MWSKFGTFKAGKVSTAETEWERQRGELRKVGEKWHKS
jgi:hypothetical protein